ncbi:MAG: ParB/RepB/Spo0J family partition protein [Spirochaetia bacterium]|nr:ParB/RepB/Spo0J family partition protein [Spirochaetia bacterium]
MANKNRKVLGRGLGNLLEVASTESKIKEGILDIKVDLIRANPNNPRKKFDTSAIEELSKTIKEHGLLQPILVTEKDNVYTVISGERRLRACRILNLEKIPCIIKNDISEEKNIQISLIENIQREQLDPIEEANVYKDLLDKYNFTQESLSEKVGKNRSTIANKIRLLKLSLEAQTAIADGRITEGQIRPVLTINDNKLQNETIKEIIKKGLNARQVEDFVKKYKEKNEIKNIKKINKKDAEIENLERQIEDKFSTRVKINYNNKSKSGNITINFFNLEDLDRILSLWGIEK